MAAPALTVATTFYLFATDWLPSDAKQHLVAVPGGSVTALDASGNLLHAAMWNLQRQGVLDFEQIRPVEKESIVVLGGRSFARFTFRDPGVDLRGLEGALIRAAREVGPSGGLVGRAIDRVTDEDDRGIRRLVAAMGLHYNSPWLTVTGHCLAETIAAGLVREKGMLIKRVEITDPPAVESLRERFGELRAARRAELDRDPDLHHAVIADCIQAVHRAQHGDP